VKSPTFVPRRVQHCPSHSRECKAGLALAFCRPRDSGCCEGVALSRVLFSSEHMISSTPSSPNWDQPSQTASSCGYCSPYFSPCYYKDPVQGRYLLSSLDQRTSKRAAGCMFTWPCRSHARVVFRSRICNSPTCSIIVLPYGHTLTFQLQVARTCSVQTQKYKPSLELE
jgi:hypothetical protein